MKIRLYERGKFLEAREKDSDDERAGLIVPSPVLRAPQVVTRAGEGDAEHDVIDFAITSEAVDRMRDVISLKGWNLKNYRRNPVVLFGHNSYDLPIGRSLKVWKDDQFMYGRAQFTNQDENAFGFTVGRMVLGKYLNATSVGFMPMQMEWESEDEERKGGINFLKQELLEYSVVPIPANPEALVQARSSGIDVGLLRDWASRVLDEKAFGTENELVAKAYEDAYRSYVGGERIFVEVDGKWLDDEGEGETAEQKRDRIVGELKAIVRPEELTEKLLAEVKELLVTADPGGVSSDEQGTLAELRHEGDTVSFRSGSVGLQLRKGQSAEVEISFVEGKRELRFVVSGEVQEEDSTAHRGFDLDDEDEIDLDAITE